MGQFFKIRLSRAGAFLGLLSCLLLSACEQREILSGLSARESLEVTVRLNELGIRNSRSKVSSSGGGLYTIAVAGAMHDSALKALHELGLPREKGLTLEHLTRKTGFIPNTAEISAVRVDAALSSQVERLVAAMPGVVEARAVVRSNLGHSRIENKKSEGADSKRSTASLVVRYISKKSTMPFSLDDLKILVSQAVPGLHPESVSINLSRVVLPFNGSDVTIDGQGEVSGLVRLWPFSFMVPEGSITAIIRQFGIVVVSSLLLGLLIGYQSNSRRNRPTALTGREKAGRLLERSS